MRYASAGVCGSLGGMPPSINEMAANPGQGVTGAGSGVPQTSGGLPVLNVAGTRVGIRILAQGQQHVSQQLATQLGGGLLSHQRVPANSCTPQQVTVSLSLSLSLTP